MYRQPMMNDGSGNSTNLCWPMNRQPCSSTNSAENNLREIRDSLIPYRNTAPTGNGGYSSAKNAVSTQAFSSTVSSSTAAPFMEPSTSNMNNSTFWSSSQQCHMLSTPNGFSLSASGLETAYNHAGLSSGQFLKSMDIAQSSTKFRPTGAHHKEALIQIKQSLQPYSTNTSTNAYNSPADGGIGNMDTLSSESSSGTTGSVETSVQNGPLHESILLDQLVQMGFEPESAWYALKLTQFRSLNLAVDVLLKLNMSHVFRDQDARNTVSRKPSFDNGENGVGRAESPMPRIPTPQNRQYHPAAAAAAGTSGALPSRSISSAVSTSGAVYSIPVANQRTPSPMSKQVGTTAAMSNYVTMVPPSHLNAASATSTSSTMTNAASPYVNGGGNSGDPVGYFPTAASGAGPKRSHITVNLQSPPTHNTRVNGASGGPMDPMLIRERVAPIILQADKRQVEKPVAQNAVAPTIIAVNNNNSPAAVGGQTKFDASGPRPAPTKVLSAHFDPQNLHTVRINVQPATDPSNGGHYVMKYQLEANTTSGHVVSIQGRGETAIASTAEMTNDGNAELSNFGRQPIRTAPLCSTVKLSSQRILLSSPLDAAVFANETKPLGPLDYSLALAQLQQQQQQQQLQNYHHQIVVGGNSSNDSEAMSDDVFDQQHQALAQRLKVFYGYPGANQKPDKPNPEIAAATTANLPAPTMMPFAQLPPPRLATTAGRPVDYFPTLKEESHIPFVKDRASPTSSVSTEESEASGGGGHSTSANTEQLVRCESPLPESILKRLQRRDDAAATSHEATASSSGKSGRTNLCSAVKPCTPQAFKFYMEQHVENVIKQHQERQTRRMQLEKEMVKAKLTSQVQCQMRKLLNNKESNYLRMKRQKMDASMFDKIQTIGVGAFGEVALVRKKDTKTLFAMKILRKSDVIQKNQAAHVKAERDILSEADNEWVVKLFYSFQDKENLFFIMEYIPGGDMMALLIKQQVFEEDLARFYIAELVCAIQSVHKLGFIHRDIKPDNILIDRNGHIKLTDFGLCTGLRWTHDWKYYAENPKIAGHVHQDSFDLLQLRDPDANHKVLCYRQQKPRQKSHSLVGTPNYIAPEVLTRSGHTQLCDWWSVGVILYEMVVGHPPFLANTPEETQYKVVNWRKTLRIPPEASLSHDTKDLILKLCCGVEDRLGREKDALDIMAHPFFKKIHWLTLRSSPAPYKPELLNELDTSNFDPVEPRSDSTQPSNFGTEKMSKHDHAFYEFTFRRFFDSDGHGCPTLKTRQPYQHPGLHTVMENSQPSNSVEREQRGAPQLNNAYSRTPVYLNERTMNILRISTDDQDQEADEETSTFSGPGRPPREDSFSYDDPIQHQQSDLDDETSDSAVYV